MTFHTGDTLCIAGLILSFISLPLLFALRLLFISSLLLTVLAAVRMQRSMNRTNSERTLPTSSSGGMIPKREKSGTESETESAEARVQSGGRRRGDIRAAGGTVLRGLALLLAFVLGYLYRDHQGSSNTHILHDIHVVRRPSTPVYIMATEFGQTWHIKFCEDYIPSFDPGITLKLLVYEDKGECSSISGKKMGYIVSRDSNGQPKEQP